MAVLATILLLISVGSFCALADNTYHKKDQETWHPECGSTNPNGNTVDDTEPDQPGPFHPLTESELRKVREFLENEPQIQADKSSKATLRSSYIFTAELIPPKKKEVLDYLDNGGPQPSRQARVIMFRGDKSPPVVEEWVCGPLPHVHKCEMMRSPNRRNPVEFSVRPLNGLEIDAINEVLLKRVDEKVGALLLYSYGQKFTGCDDKKDCLASSSSPVGTGITEDISKRLMWVTAMYNLPYRSLHTLDFAVLVDLNNADSSKWTIEKVWYSENLYDSLDDLVAKYHSGNIHKTKVNKPADDDNLFSSLKRRGDPQPANPQRPPTLVEPDGIRYSVKQKKVNYLDWTFNYGLSPTSGPSIHDVKFKGDRILYEMALSEIATFFSGHAPYGQTMNNVEKSRMIGSRSRALVKGAGCPESATLLRSAFMSQYDEEPAVYNASLCIFETNSGSPLRRHLSYETDEGGFYGGMLDSALVLRSALAVLESDYIIDIIFHQNGVIETKVMSTGYIQTSFLSSAEKPYGHRLNEKIIGNIHQHNVNFKVDLDIKGTKNRYETLDIIEEKVMLTGLPSIRDSQTRINKTLKETEREAISDFRSDRPKYHIVHNNDEKNKFNESRAYRIELKGMSKDMLRHRSGIEKSVTWARHQMVVTKRKEDEPTASSIYAMLDSAKPNVKFTGFYDDDENIKDEDLVFWISGGGHHIPHSEDIPNTPTLSSRLTFFLLPHNYHEECPSMGSRDAIFVDYKDPKEPAKGVKVDRNGNSRDQCVIPKSTLEEDLEADPDSILESRRRNPTDF